MCNVLPSSECLRFLVLIATANATPSSYDLVVKVEFETNIRDHHVYKSQQTPILREKLKHKKDNREEARNTMKMQ